jgi:hypothetical protein
MSTLSVTNLTTGSNSTPLNIATGGTYGGSIKLEASNNNITLAGNVFASNVSINGNAISPFPGGYKNKIINGNFDIWQRSTSNTATSGSGGYLTTDRWAGYWDGTIGSVTFSQQSFSLGQTDVPGEPKYFFRWNQTAAGSGSTYRILLQKIEGVRTLAGKNLTVSFWAKADSSRSITLQIGQEFGTGGSPSATVYTTGDTDNLTTSWQKFTCTIAVPSISGKTLGTGGNDCLTWFFILPLNTTMTLDFAQIQVEEGSVATAFEQRHIGDELALCQRYFQTAYLLFSGDVTSGQTYYTRMPVSTHMRTNPTTAAYFLTFAPNGFANTIGTLSNSSLYSQESRAATSSTVGIWGTTILLDAEIT